MYSRVLFATLNCLDRETGELMSTIVFGETPPVPKKCLTCKRPEWQWNGERWVCLHCANPNPCVTKYGPDPEGRHCWNCVHLLRDDYHSKTYLKCDLRENTRGAGSDHRASWDACARFTPEQEGNNAARNM